MRSIMRRTMNAMLVTLAVCLSASGIVVSPTISGKAYAADNCGDPALLGVPCVRIGSGVTGGGDPRFLHMYGNNAVDDAAAQTWSGREDNGQKWSFLSTGNGSFKLRNGNGKCLDATVGQTPRQSWSSTQGPAISQGGVYQSTCSTLSSQQWYIEPAGFTIAGYKGWAIRHVNDNKCLDVANNFTGEGGEVLLWDCKSVNQQGWNQTWFPIGGPYMDSILSDLAGTYALKRHSGDQASYSNVHYTWVSDSIAALGQHERLTDYIGNTTTKDQTYTRWIEQQTGWEHSLGGSLGLKMSFGSGELFVKNSVEIAIEAHYNYKWSGLTVYKDQIAITVPPGATYWVVRSQLYKTVTGSWELTSSRGAVVTTQGTTTIPVATAGVDGQKSALTYCRWFSTQQQCTATHPNAA